MSINVKSINVKYLVFTVEMGGLRQGCMELDDGHPTMNIGHTAGEIGDQAQV